MKDDNLNRIESYSGRVIDRKVEIFCKSNIGPRNQESLSNNQDAFEVRIDNDFAVIAVADGLGSCEFSHSGAKYVVEILCDWVAEELKNYNEIDQDILKILCNRVVDRWKNMIGENYLRYDTTLLFFIFIRKSLLIGGIGDGMILLDIDGQYQNLSWTDKVFGNQTNSIGSKNAKSKFNIKLFQDIEDVENVTVIIATDGISDDIEEENQEKLLKSVKDKIKKNGFEETTEELNQWVNNWKSLHNSDDKTLAIIDIRGKNE